MKLLRQFKNLIETNRFFSSLFDSIASTQIYKTIIKNKVNKTISNLKKNKNYNIIIETTNLCNARCIMCPHTIMKRPQKIMDDTTFNKIINQIKKEKINPTAFILNGFGEPLIDSQIINRIKFIKKEFPNSVIKFYSNLNLANKNLIKKLNKSGLDEINISLNGYNSRNYKEVMKLDYQKTIDNLKFLIKNKKETNSDLKIRISMTLVKHNEKTAKKFIQKWSSQVDSVSVNKVHSYNNSVKSINDKFKINFQKTAFPCKYIWDTITFDVNGEIVLCCLDYESQYKFGNIKSNSILKSFNSPKFNLIRQQHLQFASKNIKICQHCYTPYKNGVEWLINKLF
jgi:radical SAM protein with 4Fe4S-binding SPASM domain